MTANNHVTYDEAEKRYEMPVRHHLVQAVPVCGLPKTCCNNSALETQSARNSACASTNLQ